MKSIVKRDDQAVGDTQQFVLGQGFVQVGDFDTLLGHNGTKRLFIELFADRDRTEVRPAEAYQALLASIQPSWTIRVFQVYWPDEYPRELFLSNVRKWRAPNDGMSFLRDSLEHTVQASSIPFGRRTIIEMIVTGTESISFWETLPAMLQQFGVQAVHLTKDQVERLAHWVFNASIDNGSLLSRNGG
jgi:hypothetical protein